MPADLAWDMVGKKRAEFLLSTFKKCWRFLTLLGAIVPDFLQCVRELLGKLKEEEDLVAAAAVLMSEMEAVKIEMAEGEEKGRKYWAKALIKLIALERKNNTQTVLGCIDSSLVLNTH